MTKGWQDESVMVGGWEGGREGGREGGGREGGERGGEGGREREVPLLYLLTL